MMIFLKVCVSDADGDNLSFAYAGEASIFAQIQDRTVRIVVPAQSVGRDLIPEKLTDPLRVSRFFSPSRVMCLAAHHTRTFSSPLFIPRRC
ncbi:hypothetical protein [Burkholderia aenigmatica]|uniref:hypothetical protein n=1 Tax=Burkholderia aenigmatica TaxID=2015348 RepID=UPI001178BBB1|nr:hypothetical protein [Burkholderia aenigmatica]UKD17917.1 hypothetical protein L3V59_43540 [Burkholderia aenigmatica]